MDVDDTGGTKRQHDDVVPHDLVHETEDDDPNAGRDVMVEGFALSIRGQEMVEKDALVMQRSLKETLADRPLLPAEPVESDVHRAIVARTESKNRPLMGDWAHAEVIGSDAWRYVLRYLSAREIVQLMRCSTSLYKEMRMLFHEWKLRTAPPTSPLVWTDEQHYVYNHVIVQRRPLFLTGPAGAGKTVLMRWLMRFTIAYTDLVYKVAGSTGVCAVPIDGQTLHSLLGLGINVRFPESDDEPYKSHHTRPRPHKELRELDILFIEEPGMISAQMMRYLDEVLRASKRNPMPFGGIAVVFCGDFSQLPPIADNNNTDVASTSGTWRGGAAARGRGGGGRGSGGGGRGSGGGGRGTATPGAGGAPVGPGSNATNTDNATRAYAFRAQVWKNTFKNGNNVLVLNRSFRQQDKEFVALLNRVRNGTVTQADMAKLHARVPTSLDKVDPPSVARAASGTGTLREQREAYATRVLDAIPADCVATTGRRDTKSLLDQVYLARLPGGEPVVWAAESVGKAVDQKRMSLRRNLRLKETALVMLTANSRVIACRVDSDYKRRGSIIELPNGALGTVQEIVRTYARATEVLTYGALAVRPNGAFDHYTLHSMGATGFQVTFRPQRPWTPPPTPAAAELQRQNGCTPVREFTVSQLIVVHFHTADVTVVVFPSENRMTRLYVHQDGTVGDENGTASEVVSGALVHATSSIGGTGRKRLARAPRAQVAYVCIGSRVQFPLILARATTAHKTQGATLERSAAMLNECFELGHPYVMLSRVRRLEDLIVLNHRFGIDQFRQRAARDACDYQDTLVAPGSLAAIIGSPSP